MTDSSFGISASEHVFIQLFDQDRVGDGISADMQLQFSFGALSAGNLQNFFDHQQLLAGLTPITKTNRCMPTL